MAFTPKQHWQWEGVKVKRVTAAGDAGIAPCIVYGVYTDAATDIDDATAASSANTKIIQGAAGTTWFGSPGIRFETGVYVATVTAEALIYYKDK